MTPSNWSFRSDWAAPLSLVVLSIVPAIFGTVRLTELFGHAPVTDVNARFMSNPVPIIIHLVAVIPYSLVGAFQFSPGFRHRYRNWHRRAGRVLVLLGLVAAVSGLWLTLVYPWPAGDGVAVYVERLIAGSLMMAFILLGVNAIRHRDFAAHGDWMIRAYAIGLGAGTQVVTHLPWFIFVGKPDETARGFLMGSAWVINWLVAEWVIYRSTTRRIRSSREPRNSPTIWKPKTASGGV